MNKTLAPCLLAMVLVNAVAAQNPRNDKTAEGAAAAPNALEPLNRYDSRQVGVVVAGKTVPSHVIVRDWEIHGRQRIEKFPESGLLIVQLHSGTITTTISGKQEKRKPGDYWTVPAGTSMGLQVTSESAGLHIVAVSKP